MDKKHAKQAILIEQNAAWKIVCTAAPECGVAGDFYVANTYRLFVFGRCLAVMDHPVDEEAINLFPGDELRLLHVDHLHHLHAYARLRSAAMLRSLLLLG